MSEEHRISHGRGVAVVGGPSPDDSVEPEEDAAPETEERAARPRAPRRTSTLRRGTRAKTVAPSSWRPRGWLVPLLGTVTALSVLCAIVFGVKWSDLNAQNASRTTVQRVAKDFLSALTNFTPKSVDADFRTISTYATGDFAKQSNQFFGSSIRQQLEQAQAWSRGQVRYLYVQSLDGGQSTVYAEDDQTYANNKVTTPVTDVLQVVLGMADTSNGWKISAVTVLQPPSSPNAPTGSASSATGGK